MTSFRHRVALCPRLFLWLSLERKEIFLAVRRKSRANIGDPSRSHAMNIERLRFGSLFLSISISISLFLSSRLCLYPLSPSYSRAAHQLLARSFVIRRTPRNAFENLVLRRIPTVALKFRSRILSRVDCTILS